MTLKNLVLFLFTGVFSPGFSQTHVSTLPGPRNAIIETWNGIQCGWCPASDGMLQDIIDNNPAGRVVSLNFHAGVFAVPLAGQPDFTTIQGEIHHDGFTIIEYPQSTLNRRLYNGNQTFGYFNDTTLVPLVLAQTAEVNMYANAEVDTSTRELNIDLEYYYTADAPNPVNYLYIVVLQNNMLGPQADFTSNTGNPNGYVNYPNVYNHQRIFRMFVTNQWGDSLPSTTSSSTDLLHYTLTLPDSINSIALNLTEIEIVAFISDGEENVGDVLNGISVTPTLSNLSNASVASMHSVLVYPNPVKDQLYWEIDNEQVNRLELYNLLGQLVADSKPLQSGSIDVSMLTKGSYLLKISTDDGAYLEKVLIH